MDTAIIRERKVEVTTVPHFGGNRLTTTPTFILFRSNEILQQQSEAGLPADFSKPADVVAVRMSEDGKEVDNLGS